MRHLTTLCARDQRPPLRRNITLAPLHRLEESINAVRMFIPKCWFDGGKCQRGLDALKVYRSDWDEQLRVLRPGPVHDWTSHAADAFRYLAMVLDRKTASAAFYGRIVYPDHGIAWRFDCLGHSGMAPVLVLVVAQIKRRGADVQLNWRSNITWLLPIKKYFTC
jgi:hypothetical protein